MHVTAWLAEHGLVKECSLEALRGTRLGIDANNYLSKLLKAREGVDIKCDHFTPAIGGAPLTLTAEVRCDSISRPPLLSEMGDREGDFPMLKHEQS